MIKANIQKTLAQICQIRKYDFGWLVINFQSAAKVILISSYLPKLGRPTVLKISLARSGFSRKKPLFKN